MTAPADALPVVLACGHLARAPGERAHGTVALDDGLHAPLVFRACPDCYLRTLADLACPTVRP